MLEEFMFPLCAISSDHPLIEDLHNAPTPQEYDKRPMIHQRIEKYISYAYIKKSDAVV